jgi:hypothetical protein
MSQGIVMEEEEGGCLAIPVRLVEGGLILAGALGGVKGCSQLGRSCPGERERSLISIVKWMSQSIVREEEEGGSLPVSVV